MKKEPVVTIALSDYESLMNAKRALINNLSLKINYSSYMGTPMCTILSDEDMVKHFEDKIKEKDIQIDDLYSRTTKEKEALENKIDKYNSKGFLFRMFNKCRK